MEVGRWLAESWGADNEPKADLLPAWVYAPLDGIDAVMNTATRRSRAWPRGA